MHRQLSIPVMVVVSVLGVSIGWGRPVSARHPAAPTRVSVQDVAGVARVVDTYCAGCHNGRTRSPGGVVLDRFDASRMSTDRVVWTQAYRQLQAGTMPPVGAPRPDRAGYDGVLVVIERELGAEVTASKRASGGDIARRLAALVWDSAPDMALMQEADDLSRDADVLEGQVRRMLADDRAQAFVARFLFPWLELDALDRADPDIRSFPGYDVSLRDALVRETQLFLLSQLRDDRDPLELWRADYTFLNERLAQHYGVPNLTGPEFRRVPVSMSERSGLLGQGSVLMATSRHQHGVDAAYTTPATRAKWVRLHFLGAPLPQPFNGAQPVSPALPITPQTRVLPAVPCVTCHRNFFPLGYALENFDPIGRWRTHDQAGPVDASGTFVDDSSTNGVNELRGVLLRYPEAFRTTLLEQLLVYSSSGAVRPNSRTSDTLFLARRILRGTTTPRWSTLIAAVVKAEPDAAQ